MLSIDKVIPNLKKIYVTPTSKLKSTNSMGLKFYPRSDMFQKKEKEIISKEDYKKLIEELKYFVNPNYKNMNETLFKYNQEIYPDLPEKYQGLVPYCGIFDVSHEINRYLSGRKLRRISEDVAEKFIKVLNYSLSELDKEFGTYKGVVYRGGYFEPNSKQLFSTCKDYLSAGNILPQHADEDKPSIHVIKVNSGHKLYDFQAKYCKESGMRQIFMSEHEVLLNGDRGYIDITTAVKQFHKNVFGFKNNIFNDLLLRIKYFAANFDEIRKLCKINNFHYKTVIDNAKVWQEL